MSVVSEKAIRKIISSKIKKLDKIDEIGFKKRLRFDPGSSELINCDLSNLKNTEFAVKFAKHFIFNPEITTTTRSADGEIDTNVLTKRNLISFITGLGVSDELDKKYEDQVRQLIKQNPQLIEKWVSGLETSIRFIFGPVASLYCNALNKQMGYAIGADQLESQTSGPDNSQVASQFGQVFKASSDKFFDKERMRTRSTGPFALTEIGLLYPQTTINYMSGTSASGGLAGINDVFNEEDEAIKRIIETANQRPRRIYEALKDHLGRTSTRGVTDTLRSIKNFVNQSSEFSTDYAAGDEMRKYLKSLRESIYEKLRDELSSLGRP